MQNNPIIDELKDYGNKLGTVLEGLNNQTHDPKIGYSPREVIFKDNKLTLYHYLSDTVSQSPPLLIVYALVNRPSILDLQKNHSAIAQLLKNGEDVYLVDWGYPDKTDNELGLDDYINQQLHRCVTTICQQHTLAQINLLGICQGGALSLCYSSLHPEYVKNLILMVTPVDFQTEHDNLSNWVRHIDIDLMVDTLGNIPGSMLSNTFLTLKPYQLQLQKYLNLINSFDQCTDDQEKISNFLSMEQWIFDSPDQAGETFRHFIKSCYQQNQLLNGELKIGGKTVDLSTLNLPILNIYAEQDHLVPPAASKALGSVVPSAHYQEMPVAGGHIGIFVSRKSIKKIFPAISEWLRQQD